MEIVYHPIGIVRSPFESPDDVPVEPNRSLETAGTIEIYEEYEEGLTGLDGFSHIVVVAHLHLIDEYTLCTSPPFVEGFQPGIFATRGPRRPNPIGITIVRLITVDSVVLNVAGLDFVDGTPVLDIKPFYPKPDEWADLRGGWIEEHLDQPDFDC